VPVKNLELGPVTPAANDTVRREIKLTQGIPQEKRRLSSKAIKDKKFKKAQASIQGEEIRVQAPAKDELQEVIAFLRTQDFGIELRFGNYADEARCHLARLRQGDRRLERLVGQLVGHGAVVTPSLPDADVILVNTCGFIDAAKQESIDAILSAARLKTQGGVKAVVAVGCLVQRYKRELQQEIPEVDLFLGSPTSTTWCRRSPSAG